MTSIHLPLRLKRLRKTETVRSMLQETRLSVNEFILPLFIHQTLSEKRPIKTMPNHYQLPLTSLAAEIEEISRLGILGVILFGIPEYKDATGSASLHDTGVIQQAIQIIKKTNPDLLVITDVCLCEYTDHGHCGVLQHNKTIDNDKTLSLLAQQALSHAQAGADWVAPSSMTDGMVQAIRTTLDKAGHGDTAILSYAVKYCSCLYSPFRDAAEGTPRFGNRKTYQMNPANGNEALREAALDLAEGADLLMVKPALFYLDIIYRLKQHYPEIPLCAYQVSGEFAMIKNAAQQHLIDETAAMLESLLSIKRAGANMIISYFTKDVALYLNHNT